MPRHLYLTGPTDHQWQIKALLIPAAKLGGRSHTVDVREILNDIFYIFASGCAWRLLLHNLPPSYSYAPLHSLGLYEGLDINFAIC